MQVDVSFSKLRCAIASLKTSEKSLRKDIRQLQDLRISMSHIENTAVRRIAKNLEKQEAALHYRCESLATLQRVLSYVEKLYQKTEEDILDTFEPDLQSFEESFSVQDLRNIQQLITPFF